MRRWVWRSRDNTIFRVFSFNSYTYLFTACLWAQLCAKEHVWRSEDNSPSTMWVPETKLNIRFGGRYLYSWSHLSGPVLGFQLWLSNWLPSPSLDCMGESLASWAKETWLLDISEKSFRSSTSEHHIWEAHWRAWIHTSVRWEGAGLENKARSWGIVT